MSERMIQVTEEVLKYRPLLFALQEPVVMTSDAFQRVWPYVSSVYTRRQIYKPVDKKKVIWRYECRLLKSRESGTVRAQVEGAPAIKRKASTVRCAGLCELMMNVTHIMDGEGAGTVIIERVKGKSHSHTIDDSFRVKKPQAVLDIAREERSKNYSSAQVFHAMRGVGSISGSTQLVLAGGGSLTRQDVKNVSRYMDKDARKLQHGTDFLEDVRQAEEFLASKGWNTHQYLVNDTKGETRFGLVFAHPNTLEVLKRRGHLTLFDSTHKLNKWNHNLFSFLVRDECGTWIPTAHCMVERENGETLAAALIKIKEWCQYQWRPRYFLTDDSAIEQKAVKLAFPGLRGGEMEVTHFLCTFHSEQTLRRQLGASQYQSAYTLLRKAMYCYTGPRCKSLCEEAIRVIHPLDEKKRSYVKSRWLDSRHTWALYARQHSPLLLQVTTTNACEAWHNKLKAGAGLSKGQVSTHGVRGMAMNINQAVEDVSRRAETALFNFRTRNLAVVANKYPHIGQFPHPVQKLLGKEVESATERVATGNATRVFNEDLICDCKFARLYLLPCRHVFQLDQETRIITTTHWDLWLTLFAESGMEVYEQMAVMETESEGGIKLQDGGRVQSVLELRDLQDQLQQQMYGVFEVMREQQLSSEQQRRVAQSWLQSVRETLQPLADLEPAEIVQRNRPWEL